MEETRPSTKKVFFLYPHSVVQEQMMRILVQAEFEVVLINDHQRALSLLYRYQQSIIYINIESNLKPNEWEDYIRSVQSSREKHGATIGVLTYNPDKSIAEKYLMELGITGGCIGLKLGLSESAKIIIKTLEANEARGGRKYVRVKCNPQKTSMNIILAARMIQGELLDMSSAGFACILPQKFQVGTVLEDIQVRLWGSVMKLNGTVMGTRKHDDLHEVHVIMFNENLDREVKGKIYTFIQKAVQAEVDSILEKEQS